MSTYILKMSYNSYQQITIYYYNKPRYAIENMKGTYNPRGLVIDYLDL